MGGAGLTRPDFYCNGNHCDGYHPIDAGQNQMAATILPKVIAYYMKNPKGARAQAAAPAAPAKAQAAVQAASQTPAAASPALKSVAPKS